MKLFQLTIGQLFGLSKYKIWKTVAEQIGGMYAQKSAFEFGRVLLPYKNWKIVLETFDESGMGELSTRVCVKFVNKQGFKFQIKKGSVPSFWSKMQRGNHLETGYEDFDNAFITQGNDHYKLIQLLDNYRVRKLFQAQSRMHLSVQDQSSFFKRNTSDIDTLEFRVNGVMRDTDALVRVFDLFKEILDTLVEINVARTDDPDLV